MHDNRDMFYSDYQAGGLINPINNMNSFGNNFNPNFNAYSYQGFNTGPSLQTIPTTNMNIPNNYYDNSNYMENRILKLERQVKRLESRVTRLENLSGNGFEEISTTTDMYMI